MHRRPFMSEGLEDRTFLSCSISGDLNFFAWVFNDLNADGKRQGSEPYLANFPVTEVRKTYYSSPTQFTNHPHVSGTDGRFWLSYGGCSDDIVSADFAGKRGWRQTVGMKFKFGSPQNREIGVTQRALAAGTLFNDVNGDGIAQSHEPKVARWSIFDDTNGNGSLDVDERSVRTNSAGRWTFGDLPAGNHTLRLLRQHGLEQTAPTINGGSIKLSLGKGESINNLTFGTRGAVIQGSTFNDLNGDAVRQASSEPILSGWRVYEDANNNERFDTNEVYDVSETDGAWTLAGLATGPHRLRIEERSIWPATAGAQGLEITADLDQPVSEVLFGKQGIVISGNVFYDRNGDLVRQKPTDAGARVEVFLDENANRKLDAGERSTLPDEDGNYAFTDLPAGQYDLCARESDGISLVTYPASRTHRLALRAGDVRIKRNFAIASPIRIPVTIFYDRDKNGKNDGSDYLLGRWGVYVDLNNNSVRDTGEPSGRTGLKGETFYFHGLRPGTYTVRIDHHDGYAYSQLDGAITVTQRVGGADAVANFGVRAGSISGSIFYDVNGDGVKNTGDLTGKSVFVVYHDVNNDGQISVPTDVQAQYGDKGSYRIDGLTPGRHTVFATVSYLGSDLRVTPPQWNGNRYTFDVTPDQQIVHSFPFIDAASVSGSIFSDLNGNGIDDGEPERLINSTFAGEFQQFRVYVDLNGDGEWQEADEPSSILDGSGAWYFELAPPGRAEFRILMPPGWHQALPAGNGSYARNLQAGKTSRNNAFAVRRDS